MPADTPHDDTHANRAHDADQTPPTGTGIQRDRTVEPEPVPERAVAQGHDVEPGRTVEGVEGTFALDDASAPAEVAFAFVSETPITVEWCVDNVTSDHSGAVVTFIGIVRDHDHGRGVLRLSYTGHPTADEVMRQVAEDVAAAHPGTRIAVAHRVGELGVGDLALAAAVASAHRAQAFAACAQLVDDVKSRVPIWKEQWFTDGTTEWVGAT